MGQMKGKVSIELEHPPVIISAGSVVGKKEGKGPLGSLFDEVELDGMFGTDNWEQAGSTMQKKTTDPVIEKGDTREGDPRYLFADDLLGQPIATSFDTADLEVPFFGLYGACSAMREALGLGAIAVNAGYADQVIPMASNHFATAKKRFRFPLAYGNQRPPSTAWTVTGCDVVVLAGNQKDGMARIAGITVGRVVDMSAKGSMNMGAAMTPTASRTIGQNLGDFQVDETWYDKVTIGDLGGAGKTILLKFIKNKKRDLNQLHMDCGMEIYDKEQQDIHAGGSGCSCSTVTLRFYILPEIQGGTWRRALFVSAGTLLSSVSFNKRQSVPGIAHAVIIKHIDSQEGNDMDYLKTFIVGGIICALVQILLEKTKMMPGRVMVILVASGTMLRAIGLYGPFTRWAGAGAAVSLPGFGNILWKGVKEGIEEDRLLGIFRDGFTASSTGVHGALVFDYLASLVFKPKME